MGRPHEGLKVWQQAMRLVKAVYQATASYPSEERFGLVSQTRRAVVSIPANIAEGAARRSKPDFLRFLFISRGSLSELETLLTLSHDLGYVDVHDKRELTTSCHEIGLLLDGLIHAVERDTLSEDEAFYEA